MTADLKAGRLFICDGCSNLIREIEGYVWDPKKAARGIDEPLKENDHAVDALRYAVYNHKPVNPMISKDYWNKQSEYNQQRQYMNGSVKPASDYGFR
jgi:phage terminase large subunit